MGRLDPDRRKAPGALLHAPPLFVGCFVAALLVVLAASSPSLFTSAAGSAAFKAKLAEITPLGAGIHVIRGSLVDEGTPQTFLRDHLRRGAAIEREVGSSSRLGRLRDTLMSSPVPAATAVGDAYVVLVARTAATSRVHRLAGGGGEGVWIADNVASRLRARPGGTIRVADRPVRVAAVYRALFKEVANDDWVNFSAQIYPRGVDPDAPPTFVLTRPGSLLRLVFGGAGRDVFEVWEVPLEVDGMTLERARDLARRFARVERQVADPSSPLSLELGCSGGGASSRTGCSASSSLVAAVRLANESADAVAAPARLLGWIGLLIALGASATVGVFLVTRRRAEMRYRFARGESSAAFALRTGFELALPTALGGVAGLVLTVALVKAFEPGASLDRSGLVHAIAAGSVALGVDALLTIGAATIAFGRQFETVSLFGGLRLVPWEAAAIAGGIALLVSIRRESGISASGHPSLLVFALPLLLLAGVTGLVLRVARRALRRAGGGLPVAGYLALRRATAGPGLVVALAVLCAVSLGVLFYGQALATSLDRSTHQKALIAVGGDVQGTIDAGAPMPKLPFPATAVQIAYGVASVDDPTGPQVDLMEVEPATLAAAVHWDPGWGPAPGTFAGRLARPVDGRLPVVVTPGFGDRSAIWLAGRRVPVEVVATVRAFPGMSADAPLLVTSVAALRHVAGNGSYDPLNGLAYVWARGPVRAVEKALKASSLQPQYFVSLEDVLQNPDVAAVKRTLSLLIALGVGVAALSLVGVGLYLYARQRNQAIASALARRMGLTRGAEIRSLWLELVGILVVSGALAAVVGIAAAKPVIGQTDPLPRYRPAPSLVVPWTVVAATFAALLAVALVAAVTTSAAARRANVAEELRLV